MVNLFVKHELVSRTYFNKSLIMALIFSTKSKSSMIIESWNEPSDFVCKPDKAVSLPTNASCTPERRLIKVEDHIGEEEEVYENELDGDGDDNPTRLRKYADRLTEMPRSHPIGYYLKHDINRKTIKDLVDNHEYNDALLKTRLEKMDSEVYESLPPILYPVDFMILDIEVNEDMPLILGTSFLTTARADIRCSDGSMTLRAGKFRVRFIKTLRFPRKVRKKKRNGLLLMIPTNHVNKRILEWQERIEKCKEDEMEFGKWRSKVFDDKNLVGCNLFIYEHELKKDDVGSMKE
ncbi:hypothetical protein Tco_0737249 [Tanacetum coccineum]